MYKTVVHVRSLLCDISRYHTYTHMNGLVTSRATSHTRTHVPGCRLAHALCVSRRAAQSSRWRQWVGQRSAPGCYVRCWLVDWCQVTAAARPIRGAECGHAGWAARTDAVLWAEGSNFSHGQMTSQLFSITCVNSYRRHRTSDFNCKRAIHVYTECQISLNPNCNFVTTVDRFSISTLQHHVVRLI